MAQSQYTPFPTFGGPKDGGGIMDVKLSPSQMRFPTARRPASRQTTEPDLDEKLAPLLPFALSGLKSLFKGSPELMDDSAFFESIGADAADPSFTDTSRLEAYKIYGPEQEAASFGGGDLLDLLIAGKMGRGGDDFAKSTANLKTAKENDRTSIENRRATFLSSRKEPKGPEYSYANFLNINDEKNGIKRIYSGRINTQSAKTELLQPDGSYISAGPGFVKQTGTQNLNIQEDPKAKEWNELTDTIYVKEDSAVRLNTIAGGVYDQLESLDSKSQINPNTITSKLAGIADQGFLEIENLTKAFKFNTIDNYFSDSEDGGNAAEGRAGTGQNAKELYNAVVNKDEKAKEMATKKCRKCTKKSMA